MIGKRRGPVQGGLAEPLECMEAFAGSRLVPHDRMLIACPEDEGRTCTIFRRHAAHGTTLHGCAHDTSAFDPSGRACRGRAGIGVSG